MDAHFWRDSVEYRGVHQQSVALISRYQSRPPLLRVRRSCGAAFRDRLLVLHGMLQRDAQVQLVTRDVAPLANVEDDRPRLLVIRHRFLILPEILKSHPSVHPADGNTHQLIEGGEDRLSFLAIRNRLLVPAEIAQRNATAQL